MQSHDQRRKLSAQDSEPNDSFSHFVMREYRIASVPVEPVYRGDAVITFQQRDGRDQ
jgi:hypothetical protein